MNRVWGKRSLSYLDDPRLHPKIKEFMTDVLKESKYDMSIIDGARNLHDQKVMFDNKRSELDGTTKLSDHQIEKYADHLGRAIDFIPYVPNLKINIWKVSDTTTNLVWTECYRAILRVDRLWKQKGIDVGLEFGWTYNISGGRDYPHLGFKKL